MPRKTHIYLPKRVESDSTTVATTNTRRPSLEGGLPPWAPTSSSSTQGRRPSLDGGLPPWASPQQPGTAQATENLAATAAKRLSAQEEGDAADKRRPGLAGGMPAWAPAEGTATTGSDESSRRKRRSSLDRGMPAWAPPPVSTAASESLPTTQLSSREAEGPSPTEPAEVEPSVPDWLAAAAGGPGAVQVREEKGGSLPFGGSDCNSHAGVPSRDIPRFLP